MKTLSFILCALSLITAPALAEDLTYEISVTVLKKNSPKAAAVKQVFFTTLGDMIAKQQIRTYALRKDEDTEFVTCIEVAAPAYKEDLSYILSDPSAYADITWTITPASSCD